ncbi:heme peroxidase, plant/fungal/bacterial [Corchorus capsularis]|uniref:L-ascorbate peroxidase n=1 Tax=Corchorus capsularis TaxID=210143 RepID=A0A1R3GU68_COCAP|nr:heme peroxidase, plant/fungal/bacterial [Corchorus capsularis]
MTSSSANLSSSLFSSSPTFSSPKLNFKFPSVSQRPSLPTVESRVTPFIACSSTISKSSGPIRHCSLSRRRGLAFTTTLPFLLPLYEFVDNVGAIAAESDQTDYLRIKEEISKVVTKGKAAGVLRLVFHDGGTFHMAENSGGMNGSIVFELERPENAGLNKSLKVLEKAKKEVDAIKPVSWADMIAVGGAEAVAICGGPKIPVALGRLDSAEPDPEGKLPQESLDAAGLKQCFQRKGFSTQELVALSGAHTLGSKGFGSPVAFDNTYFKILLQKPWKSSGGMSTMIGLPSDHAIGEDDECLRWITKYADDQNMFFEDFKNAYIKLVNSGVRWKNM